MTTGMGVQPHVPEYEEHGKWYGLYLEICG